MAACLLLLFFIFVDADGVPQAAACVRVLWYVIDVR